MGNKQFFKKYFNEKKNTVEHKHTQNTFLLVKCVFIKYIDDYKNHIHYHSA